MTVIIDGTLGINKVQAGVVTPANLTQPLTLETSKATTSGTSIDFTAIPAWVKRITMMFNGVSTNGTSILQVQLGSTTYQVTGNVSWTGTSGTNTGPNSTGFYLTVTSDPTFTRHGSIVFSHAGNNSWVASGAVGTGNYPATITGSVTLAGVLDRIRLTTVNGTDTFDAGSVNIMYEG